MSGWVFVANLLVAMQLAAVVIALLTRVWVLRPEPVVLRGIDVPRASELVGLHLQGVYDHRFAFPTGMFYVDRFEPESGSFTAREQNLRGSIGFAYMRRMFLLIPYAGARVAGWWGFAIGLFIGVWFGLFFAVLAVIEIVYRALLRSRIDADVRPHGELADAVTVSLGFRGLSAWGVQQDVLTGLRPAQLPARLRPPAPVEEGRRAPRPRDRFQAVYGGGIAVAAVVALILTLATGRTVIDESPPSGGEQEVVSGGGGQAPGGEQEEAPAPGSDPGSDADGEAPPPSTDPEPARVTQADRMERAVRRHWNNRLRGDAASLSEAYQAYGPPLKQKAGAYSRWVAGIRTDGLRDITISRVSGRLIGRGTGRVDARIRTESDDRPCVDWRFRYTMRRVRGQWLLWDATRADDTLC